MKRALAHLAKTVAWRSLDLAVRAAQRLATASGRTKHVKVIVYKVDRLGDWFLAQPSLARVVAHTDFTGGTSVVWASTESAGMRALLGVDCPVETVAFEPRGWVARARRTWAVFRLLAEYRAETLYCFRHGPDPIRDFVLRTAAVQRVYALSWRIGPGALDEVPHETRRHQQILRAADIGPRDAAALLPRLAAPRHAPAARERVVIAPFSSARVKDWPDAAWCELIPRFASRHADWELWVGPDQFPRARALADRIHFSADGESSISVKSGSLTDLLAAIGGARLVISVDSLAAHLATALDVPLIALLGGGQPGDFAPWAVSPRQRWISHALPCYHCNWNCTRAQNDCVSLITPDLIQREIETLWPATPVPLELRHIPIARSATLTTK